MICHSGDGSSGDACVGGGGSRNGPVSGDTHVPLWLLYLVLSVWRCHISLTLKTCS